MHVYIPLKLGMVYFHWKTRMVGDHGSENQVIVKGHIYIYIYYVFIYIYIYMHLSSSSVDVGMATLRAMAISKVLCVCVFSHAS